MRSKQPKVKFNFPEMSWEKPIEQELLAYCKRMASNHRLCEEHHKTGWFSDKSLANKFGAAAMAYETVAKHIEKEITIRERIKNEK